MSANPESEGFTDYPQSGSNVAPSGAVSSLQGRLLHRLLLAIGSPPLEFQLWTGERICTATTPVMRIRILDRAMLRAMLRDPYVQFGDGYSAGRIEVDGDLVQFMELMYRASQRAEGRHPLARRFTAWLHRPKRNTLAGSRDNIHHHYDISNEFYALWLGETMAYTCAYYPTATATLEQAQVAKMDHVCRKLQLRAGESVVEAGCGWGGLALHMASHYGVKVRAFNISREQLAFARGRAQQLGLNDRVEFVEDDYRNISGRYDAFVSVGMLEHVGAENYEQLGRVVRNAITEEGRGLIHSIGRNSPAPLHPWIERRIFPGAYAPALSEIMQIFEGNGLSVLDVENIRLHYALTLRDWLQRYDQAEERVRAMFDQRFVRMWRLYLAGSISAFETGTLQLFQVTFSTRDNNNIPLTRDHLYQH